MFLTIGQLKEDHQEAMSSSKYIMFHQGLSIDGVAEKDGAFYILDSVSELKTRVSIGDLVEVFYLDQCDFKALIEAEVKNLLRKSGEFELREVFVVLHQLNNG
jgi:hypothetical protein